MEKVLKLYRGANDTPFPSSEDQIEIGAFRYDAKRMGGAPTITATVMYPTCLDDEWSDNVYAEFNGEKYYLKQTPTSSYSNEDERYKHDLELVSERRILDDVYFFDVVVGDPQGDDKPVSNSTKVVFFGSVYEFVARLNASLLYSHIDYTVVVDDEITTEEKLMSFEDAFFSNVLQEIYNTYGVPYYFDGKVIHIGYSKEGVVIPDLSYGVDNALLSITKNNANYKIVNRATGTGSSDNIPFYYPNNSPKGDIVATPSRGDMALTVVDMELYANEVAIDGELRYERFSLGLLDVTSEQGAYNSGDTLFLNKIYGSAKREFSIHIFADGAGVLPIELDYAISNVRAPLNGSTLQNDTISCRFSVDIEETNVSPRKNLIKSVPSGVVNIPIESSGDYTITIVMEFASKRSDTILTCNYSLLYDFDDGYTGWTYNGKEVDLKNVGLRVDNPISGDTITQTFVKYVKTSQNLLPSVYRETDGAERFYNAVNGEDGYQDESGNDIVFNNPYAEGRPKEHIITVEDIKPTIEGTEVNGLRIDMFSEFAYDDDDNDELVENEEGSEHEYVHSYFFAKLRKLDFNLFDHAIENQPMTISFTSGDCGACNFEIGVTEEFPQKNPVQVNADGTLKRDEKGRVICGQFEDITEDECQPQQQDTINNEVWIALKKEDSTYGILMPKAPTKDEQGNEIGGHRPKGSTWDEARQVYLNDGDTFVILGINLPLSYILNAEKKLEAEIIKYLQENNDEKFTFSIGFSRIFFEENATVLNQLSENSKIRIIYDEKPYDLYVSSFSYNMAEGDALPEIRVELDETLKVSQNALQNAISQVKSELGRAIGSVDVVGAATPYFLRKDADDEAQGKINFVKGIKFGEGGKVEVLDNNSAKLTIEYLEVTKKASFTSLEIQEKIHVGGQMLITPAAINCGEVEEFDDYYRCYFQTKGADGDEIFNQFAVGDQAICQTYNAWGSKYYWRLVVGIGEDYIDLSKAECDEDSGFPSAGDKIIQLGNQVDKERQNAIVIAAYGDGSPYIIQYKGIDAFELPEDKIVTKLSSTENIFTGKVHMEMGSDGFGNLEGLPEFVEDAIEGIQVGGQNILRNSGFTGDYLSEQLADESVLDSVDEMFNPPLVHWDTVDAPAVNATVEDSDASASGKKVVLAAGSITQKLHQRTIAGETYILTFTAKGTGLTYSVGGVTKDVELTPYWVRYNEKIVIAESGDLFAITNATCELCEIQLERGTVATSWSNSPLDNASDRAYYESLKFLEQALNEGSTDILGGLVLTNHIKVGNYADKEMVEETGGINGSYVDGDSVAFWAGGSLETALETAKKYATSGTTPVGEIPYAVTHSGRVILNDAVVRGAVYAQSGTFKGAVYAQEGEFTGKIESTEGYIGGFEIGGNRIGINEGGDDNGMFLYDQFIGFREKGGLYGDVSVLIGSNVLPSTAGVLALANFEVSTSDSYEALFGKAYGIICSVDGYKESYAFSCPSGTFAGLRPKSRQVSGEAHLDEYDHTIFASVANTSIYLPASPKMGQEYVILTKGAGITIYGNGNTIYRFHGNTEGTTIRCDDIAERLETRIYWNVDDNKWWATFVKH